MWDPRTKTYMRYRGIPPLNVEVGRTYKIAWVDYDDYGEASYVPGYKIVGVKTFKTVGRRWTISSGITCTSFLYEREILEQAGRNLVVGVPWNYAKFNPDYADIAKRKMEIFLESMARSRAADESRYAMCDEFDVVGFTES